MAELPERVAGFGSGPVSTEPYWSEAFYAGERDRIFARAWLNIARVEEIPRAGDYILRDIEICRASLIIVRGDDGVLRCLHNICAHRGNPVVTQRTGHATGLACRYHGWSYALDGAARHITAADRFPGLDPAACGLMQVALEVWRGFVFVNLDPAPQQKLSEFLGGYAAMAEGYPFERGTACVTMQAEIQANWKVALDAFQETYHLSYLHRGTMRDMYRTRDDASGSFLSIDFYGPHRRYSVWANPDHAIPAHAHVERLVRGLARNINAGMQNTDEPAITDRCPGLNPTRDARWAWDNSFVFPNTVITYTAEIWIMSRFWPLAIDRCRWENFTFYPQPRNASERFAREYGFNHLRDVAAEDVETMEGSTRALLSGFKREMHLQESEIGLRHFLHTVQNWVRP